MSLSEDLSSLLATTYNQAQDLDLHLECLRRQTCQDFELLVADDGSTPETSLVIERHRHRWAGDRIKHIWHEDQGYRKATILNEAIRASRGKWLIFTDADTLLHPDFVADHRSMKKANRLFMGRRSDLGPSASNWIRTHSNQLFDYEFYARIGLSRLAANPSENINRSIRVENEALARWLGAYRVPDLLGSNFSIDRDLLIQVNGFDESNEHYWGEDGDLFARCLHAGADVMGRKLFAVQWHLWHNRREPKTNAFLAYSEKLKNKSYVRCDHGLVG